MFKKAAHCFKNKKPESLGIIAGGSEIRSAVRKCYKVSKMVPHPEWNGDGITPDIGVIKLQTKIDFQSQDKENKVFFKSYVNISATNLAPDRTLGDVVKRVSLVFPFYKIIEKSC